MSSRTRVIVVTGMIMWSAIVISQMLPVASAQPVSAPSLRSAADLAVGLAQSGHSAGMVIRLPAALEPMLAREQSQTNGLLINQSPFGIWIRNDVSDAKAIPALAPAAAAEGTILGFAQQTGLEAAKWRGTATYLLKSPAGAVCSVKLRSSWPHVVASRNLVDLVTSAIHVATNAKVPGGYVGSCIGANEYMTSPVQLAEGQSLEDALSAAVTSFGGAVWVAVQDPNGHCSLGIVLRAETGGACKTAITSTLDSVR